MRGEFTLKNQEDLEELRNRFEAATVDKAEVFDVMWEAWDSLIDLAERTLPL